MKDQDIALNYADFDNVNEVIHQYFNPLSQN